MQHQYAFEHGSNVVCFIIFDDSSMQNNFLVRSVTNFLSSRSMNDGTHLWVLEINKKIVVNYK